MERHGPDIGEANRAAPPGPGLNSEAADCPAPVDLHLAFLAELGLALPRGARILDFGCGAGDAVELLCRRGFDAYGVDVNPYWTPIWERRAALAGRVSMLDAQAYAVPFRAGFFDFAFSDQVFEHVADCPAAFRELARVLKPGAVSLHRFPGPNCPIEGHTMLPVPALCRWPPYLALWAMLGRRAGGQSGLSRRETVADNRRRMADTFLPSKRLLRRHAAEAGVAIDFVERREFAICTVGRLAKWHRRAAAAGLGALTGAVLPLFAQRYMLLRRADDTGRR